MCERERERERMCEREREREREREIDMSGKRKKVKKEYLNKVVKEWSIWYQHQYNVYCKMRN